ncbi:MAG TPA: hypothetical protein VGF96_15775 [Terracidiphilus sp.]
MSTAGFCASGPREVWLLANATVYEAREVAKEFNGYAARWRELIKGIRFLFALPFVVKPGLGRLSLKQAKLITKLQAARPEDWSLENCREMSDLLHDLVVEEGTFLDQGWDYIRKIAPPIAKRLKELREQLDELDVISTRLDILSIPQREKPGHREANEFLMLLSAPEEFDVAMDEIVKGKALRA